MRKTILAWLLCWLCCGAVTSALARTNAVPAEPVVVAPAASATSPGLELARTISLITGVAISPLLGVGTVGAWEYFSTPPDKRHHLNWYAHPAFWIPALLLVALVALKDILGTAAPSVLKKPFDVAELIENKISGLVAAGAFVPLIIKVFGPHSTEGAQAWMSFGPKAAWFATIDGAAVLNTLLTPFAIIAFVLVWLASHAISILIVLSPFTMVDALLKGVRLLVLLLVTVTYFLNPYVGAAFALLIIIASYFLAGWSFRLLVLGGVYAWDYLTGRCTRFRPQAEACWMFTAADMGSAPVRTYGRLLRAEDGQLAFEYGPWILLKKRTVALPPGTYAVGRGLFYSEILLQGEREKTFLLLPPRYRSHEEVVAQAYALAEVKDVGWRKGFRGACTMLKGLAGFGGAGRPAAG
jgi:hypothetical protein